MDSYVERWPLPELAHAVRTVWVHTTGAAPYAQRHLPTGGAELHWRVGAEPTLLGPLTAPRLEIIPPHSTILGVRFAPGAAPVAGPEDLLDCAVALRDVWGAPVDALGEAVASAADPHRALDVLQADVLRRLRHDLATDPLIDEAVRALMPWHPVPVATVADRLGLSASQLRRRCVQSVGITPKGLQRTLRFQAFLALAQAGAAPTGRRGADGIAGLAVDVGYADQAHLSRECLRLTGVTPTHLLGGDLDRCACGHDHAASYRPFLATRNRSRPLA